MKKILLLTLLGTLYLNMTVSGQGVDFFGGTLEEVLAKAKTENKRIFMDFYTDWCGPCKAIAKYVFPEAEAGDYFNARFVSIKVDAEKGTGVELAERFDVHSYPTFIILDSDGETLARWTGGSSQPTPKEFIAQIEKQLELGPDGDPQETMIKKMLAEQRAKSQPGEQTKPGIRSFEGTYAEALAKAKEESKMVFVDCYTQWCGPCKMMDADIFPRQDVGDFINPRFVFLKLDMENGEGPALADRFNVRAYPTYIIMDSSANEIARFTGGMSSDAFIARIYAAIDETKTLEALQAHYDGGQRDREFIRDYIGALSGERKRDEALAAVTEYMAGLTEEEKLKAENWGYWTEYNYAPVDSDNFDYIVQNRYKFEVGKREVTDWFLNVTKGSYAAIAFGDSPDAAALATVDELAKKVEVENSPVVELYRAAATARLDGNNDALIDAYTKYGRSMLSEYDQRSFLIFTMMTIPSFSQAQRERLILLTSDEEVKKRILAH